MVKYMIHLSIYLYLLNRCSNINCSPICGDGICHDTESCLSCPSDCGSCIKCGDRVCSDGENINNCEIDCSYSSNRLLSENNIDSNNIYVLIGLIGTLTIITIIIFIINKKNTKSVMPENN